MCVVSHGDKFYMIGGSGPLETINERNAHRLTDNIYSTSISCKILLCFLTDFRAVYGPKVEEPGSASSLVASVFVTLAAVASAVFVIA